MPFSLSFVGPEGIFEIFTDASGTTLRQGSSSSGGTPQVRKSFRLMASDLMITWWVRRHQVSLLRWMDAAEFETIAGVIDGLSRTALFLVLDGIQDPLATAPVCGWQRCRRPYSHCPKDKAVGLNATAIRSRWRGGYCSST